MTMGSFPLQILTLNIVVCHFPRLLIIIDDDICFSNSSFLAVPFELQPPLSFTKVCYYCLEMLMVFIQLSQIPLPVSAPLPWPWLVSKEYEMSM